MKQKTVNKTIVKGETKKLDVSWTESVKIWKLIVFSFAFLLYANSINSGYNLDDNLVTQKHRLTSKGISALPKIFTSPYYQDDMGYSYEYRPMVLASFAIEKSIFGENPKVSHFINVLLYAVLCLLLFDVLLSLFVEYSMFFALGVSLLFTVHTIHTEVVCSIKNRDELLAMIFALLSLKFSIKFIDGNKLSILLVPLFYLAALMSKVTIMSFAFIIPGMLILFRKVEFVKYLSIVLVLVFLGHFFITNVGNLNRHLFISFLIFLFNIILYSLLKLGKLKYNIKDVIKSFVAVIKRYLKYVRIVSNEETFDKTGFFDFPSRNELLEGLKMPSITSLIPATLFFAVIGINYFYFQGYYLLIVLLLGVFSFFFLPSKFVVWLKLVISIFCFIVLLSFENASPFIPALVQILLFVSYRIHQKENGSVLLFFGFLIFSLTDLIIHKEFGFLIILLTGTKIRKYLIFILFSFFIFSLFGIFKDNPFDILQYEQILPNLLILILFFNKSHVKYFINLFYLVIVGMLYVSILYINKPLPQKFVTKPKPNKVEVYKNFIPTGNDRELSFIEQPVKGSDPIELKLGTSSVILLKYLEKLVLPYPLSFYYGYKEIEPTPLSNPVAKIGVLIYFFLFSLLVYAWFKDKILAAGLLIYLLAVVIFANFLFPVAGMFAERFLLVPSLGFCIIIVWILAKVFNLDLMGKLELNTFNPIVKYGFVSLLSLYSFLTFSRNLDWKDKITLYRADINTVPNSAHAHNILALELMSKSVESGNSNEAFALRNEAKSHFKKSLIIYSEFFNVLYDLGRVYMLEQNADSAIYYFKKSSELPNSFPPVYVNLAEMYKMKEDTLALLDCYKILMVIDSSTISHLQSYYYYQFKMRNYREALNTVFKVYRKAPKDIPAIITLAETYDQMGKMDSAKYFYNKAYELNPSDELKKKLDEFK